MPGPGLRAALPRPRGESFVSGSRGSTVVTLHFHFLSTTILEYHNHVKAKKTSHICNRALPFQITPETGYRQLAVGRSDRVLARARKKVLIEAAGASTRSWECTELPPEDPKLNRETPPSGHVSAVHSGPPRGSRGWGRGRRKASVPQKLAF